jgi:hypothetical protein
MSKEILVKVHPLTAGVGVLCIDRGETRGVLPLKFIKRIEDCIGLKMPLQSFFKVAFGISSGTSIHIGNTLRTNRSRGFDRHGNVH